MSDKEKELNIERATIFTDNPQTGDIDAVSCEGACKLGTNDWESPLLGSNATGDIFEVRFKNTRKGYYQNVNGLPLKKGDIVAVESSPGHDIGIIALSGDMVRKQMRCKGFDPAGTEFRKIYRFAKGNDIVKWQESIALEYPTMIKARRYAQSLGLNMKIGDVEFQGDKVKAIFYYIADARVDFRELIRVFAEEFKVRIEMKQIGARQEAGRIGGIGSCGRELCCSTWVTNFVSVTTNSARFQEISLNPQKLAGQCGKLKCCLNYEVDSYIDSRKGFPKLYAPLETLEATYHLVKPDILKREMIFSSDPHSLANLVSVPIERVKEIIHLNKKGVKVDRLKEEDDAIVEVKPDYMNVVGDDSITRFDKGEEGAGKPRRNKNRNKNRQQEAISEPLKKENVPSQQRRELQGEAVVKAEAGAKTEGNAKGEGAVKQENTRQQQPQQPRPPRERRDNRENKEKREEKDIKDNKEGRQNKEGRENRPPRPPREPREPREQREPKAPNESNVGDIVGMVKEKKDAQVVEGEAGAVVEGGNGGGNKHRRPHRRWNGNKKGGNNGGGGAAE